MTISDKLMKEYLQAMPKGPFTTRQLSRRLERNDSNVRRALFVMMELGIIGRERVGPNRYVWKKLVTI